MKQQKWIIWIICGAILFGAGFWYTKGQDPVTKESNFQASVSESSAPAGDTSKPVNTDSSEIAVFICGAVKHPGVYRFSESVRICDVIASAGGLTKKADTDAVNQARFVQDGEQIEIPRRIRCTDCICHFVGQDQSQQSYERAIVIVAWNWGIQGKRYRCLSHGAWQFPKDRGYYEYIRDQKWCLR
mgnify:CR=1 FL=1